MHYYDSEYDVRVVPVEAHDSQPVLAQAAGQEPVGQQCIFQFEFMDDDSSTVPLIEQFYQALPETIHKALGGIEAKHIQRWSTFQELGDGVVILAIFPDCWRSKSHVDLILYYTSTL